MRLRDDALPARRMMCLRTCVGLMVLVVAMMAGMAKAESNNAKVSYDATARVFRLDADRVSYVFGVNENDQLQTLYWGNKLAEGDSFKRAHSARGTSSFDPSVNATLQEYLGWGGGAYVRARPQGYVSRRQSRSGSALCFAPYRRQWTDHCRQGYFSKHFL